MPNTYPSFITFKMSTIYFKLNSENAVLSNLWTLPSNLISFHGYKWPSIEHAYQCEKLSHHNLFSPSVCEFFIHCTPMQAMFKAKQLLPTCAIKQSWKDKQVSVMWELLKIKAQVCPSFKEAILQPGQFVEDTNHMFWGRGVNGKGRNMLGRLMCKLRRTLD